MDKVLDYQSLKERQRAERVDHHPNLALRVHRALSWLQRAEQLKGDLDTQFISLWIAFNAAYATEINDDYRTSEQSVFKSFIKKLLELDQEGLIEQLVWHEFSGNIRVLLNNHYIFQDFWGSHNGKLKSDEWKETFKQANEVAKKALGRRKTDVVLSIVLSRVYTLRNQIIHGGSTWNSQVNREQLDNCTKMMWKLVPLIIHIMLEHPKSLWGEAVYPVINA